MFLTLFLYGFTLLWIKTYWNWYHLLWDLFCHDRQNVKVLYWNYFLDGQNSLHNTFSQFNKTQNCFVSRWYQFGNDYQETITNSLKVWRRLVLYKSTTPIGLYILNLLTVLNVRTENVCSTRSGANLLGSGLARRRARSWECPEAAAARTWSANITDLKQNNLIINCWFQGQVWQRGESVIECPEGYSGLHLIHQLH